MIEGIDASYYQNPKENPSDPGSKRLDIDWPAVAQAGKKFAIIRSGDGTFLDPCYEQNIRGAVAAGLHVEVYHFMRFALTPQAHADLLTRRLELAVSLGAASRMWLDWEDTAEAANKLTVALRRVWAKGVMGGLSFPFGHYTGAWWWKPYMGDWDPGEPHWLATYGADEPDFPPGWETWLVWQYSAKGDVPGIVGAVDLNLARSEFLKEENVDEARVKLIVKELLGYPPHEPDENVIKEMRKVRFQSLVSSEAAGLALAGTDWRRVREIMDFFSLGREK